ncbi:MULTISPECIES: peptidoglycan editing factor PgeF [unclassified Lysobacter]|uniref:peptidoglycan editing factor PgeF n=1 Tax=unclassified Lysobacter TaxID=2635362 RepID=UPI001C23E7C0|nr:peptidoglycan editing factor PgeF [Lysobacter sp. MMG2]MBU8975537.1 peptidoglycan editing factor PgeF [Lysobacter sp. MMG2]
MAAPWLDAQWPAPSRVHGFTTLRHGLGVSQAPFDELNLGLRAGDDAQAVERNRALLAEQARLPSAPCWLRQVHGVDVHRFDEPATEEVTADASVTSQPGVVLSILTADCMPVLFCAEEGDEIGAAHAGWRGLVGGVLENTLAAMRTAPVRMHVWLGPAAGPQAYEIGEEVYDAFVSRDWAAGSAFVTTRPHHWRVDLYALARQRLLAAGMSPERIHGGGLCTISEPQRFFSHRRDQRTGRMASLLWIDPRE